MDQRRTYQIFRRVNWMFGSRIVVLSKNILATTLGRAAEHLGYVPKLVDSARIDLTRDLPFMKLYHACEAYTMTSVERMYALYLAVQYVVAARIPGCIVECGVWRGGSCMLAARVMMEAGDLRDIWLYDTFEGMVQPGDLDVRYDGKPARQRWAELGGGSNWCAASLQEVRLNLSATGYPEQKLRFIKGRVEETLKANRPEEVSLLRLDTDWYESTKAELETLFPLLSHGGVLIVDDYGHWDGAKRAVDEYLSKNRVKTLLNRIDYTGRVAVKT